MQATEHSIQRFFERLRPHHKNPSDLLKQAAKLHNPNRHQAFLLYKLPEHKGDTKGSIYDRQSNGNEVWAVVRQGKLATIMFRRSTQPKVADSFSVQDTVDLTPPSGPKLLHSQNIVNWR